MKLNREMVVEAAKNNGVGFCYTKHWDGLSDVKVFISSLGLGPIEEVKQELLRLMREGQIRLARLDLVGAVKESDRHYVKASEIQYLDTSFHFVLAPEAHSAISL